jgi:hypothetical protein
VADIAGMMLARKLKTVLENIVAMLATESPEHAAIVSSDEYE